MVWPLISAGIARKRRRVAAMRVSRGNCQLWSNEITHATDISLVRFPFYENRLVIDGDPYQDLV